MTDQKRQVQRDARMIKAIEKNIDIFADDATSQHGRSQRFRACVDTQDMFRVRETR